MAKKRVKYDTKFCNDLIEHCKQGLSFETFAVKIGCSRQSLYDWARDHDEFSEAKEDGMLHRKILLEKLLIGVASGKIKGNPATLIFSAKNILGWRDQAENEGSANLSINLKYNLDDITETKVELGDDDEKGSGYQ